MKNLARRPRWGPTTGPPLSTSQLVATKITSPPRRPVTRPCTMAFSRMIRVRTTYSRRLSPGPMAARPAVGTGRGAAPGRSEVLKELSHEVSLGPALACRQVHEHGGIAKEGRRPAPNETDDDAVEQPDHAARRAHHVPGEVLAQQRQAGADDVASLGDENQRAQQEREPAGESERDPEGDAVELAERLPRRVFQALGRESCLADLLVVLRFSVDAPQVVALAEHGVADGEHAGEHRVILVVVAMQSVAPNRLKILEPVEELADHSEVLAVPGVVDRVGLGDPDHASVLDVLVAGESDAVHLTFAQLDQLGVGGAPYLVALRAEVLEPETGLGGVRHH